VEAAAMNFVNGRVLWAIPVIVPGVIWFLWWSWRKRQALVRLFVSERLLPQLLQGVSPRRQKIKMALQVAAVLFLMVALARPQWGFVWQEANQRGRDILVAIDTSRSMLAEDMAPNRLARAKLAALDLLRLAKNDRLGLIAFAGTAFLQCPLTLDEEAFRQNVDALDTSIIPQGGTALTEAIQAAVGAFSTEEGDNHRVLVIFTDGEDHDGGAVRAAEDADNHKLRIFTVGVGTPAGELVKITDSSGQSNFVRDEKGNVVKSRLNEDLLRQIATAAKGFYIPLREGNAMQALYKQGLEPLPTSDISSKLVRELNEQFQWPLGIAIALLLIEALLPAAASKKQRSAVAQETRGNIAVAALLMLLLAAPAAASPSRAYRDYKAGNFKDARNEYERLLEKKPDDPKLNYNAGAAAYRAGAYDAAVKAFSNATKAPELDLQEMAYYNLGNSNYRLGVGETQPDKKMAVWHEAVQNYESALKLNPKDADAQFNHDLVKKELEKLKQEQQQKNQDKNDNKDQNKDDKNKGDKNQEKQNQDQNKDNKDQKQEKKEDQNNQNSKSDEQKKEDEKKEQQQKQQEQQQQKDQQQQQAQNDKKEGEDKKDSQQKNGQEANNDKKSEEQREAEQEARAAQMAQMTPKQAQQLLDAQKSQEKALIYRQEGDRKKGRERALKDW
jgi:Ca-activated chloride channel family protein